MRIDGKALADAILGDLTSKVNILKRSGITPTLAVILVGNDPGSLSYIKQKQKAAQSIGASLILRHLSETISSDSLQSAIADYNNNPSIHGLIIQRPVPQVMGEVGDILNSVAPSKDVDGFLPHSVFEVPVARAVMTIIESVHKELTNTNKTNKSFTSWLTSQTIAVVGRGETAGKPIAAALNKRHCATSIIHSKTTDPESIIKKATVIISCVGKKDVLSAHMINPGTILISVGLWRDTDGKLHGDYETEEIKDLASFYTPTPGGVGPVNVACLMQNLIDACIMSRDSKIFTKEAA